MHIMIVIITRNIVIDQFLNCTVSLATVQTTQQQQCALEMLLTATVLSRITSVYAAKHDYLIVTLTMMMSSCGLSVRLFVLAFEMFCTTSMPFVTLPNTVCLLSSHGCQPDTKTLVYTVFL